MSNSLLDLSKTVYSLDIIRSTILSFSSGACQIRDNGNQWLIDVNVMKDPIKTDEFLRRLDEFSLRASLEKRFAIERDEIFALAFGNRT